MPKRTDIDSILILGAGPIVIGQACEFDYSGAQACKALREEGFRVILVNSNPATIMTDPAMADATYVEPVEWATVARIIEQERPGALLPTMGGQTALNCALDLVREGVLERFGVELIGASQDAIDKAEDRERFDKAMKRIGLETPRSAIAHSMEEAVQVQAQLGFPCIIRPSFTLGGSGGGIAYNAEEFAEIWLNRKSGPHGRAHRGQHYGGSGADAHGQGISAAAQRLHRRSAGNRGGYRRLQRAVRHPPGNRSVGGDRDEPEGFAVVGAGFQGHRLPHRQDRREAGSGLHAGRARQ
jgi:hypothetical protein